MGKQHRVRMFFALVRYRLRTALRRSSIASWLVLLVALYISLSLLIAPMQTPLRAIGIDFPSLTRYEVSGTVRDDVGHPIGAVSVNVGGYSTSTDAAGEYTLRFAAGDPEDVVIVFTSGSTSQVTFLDFSAERTRTLDEKIR